MNMVHSPQISASFLAIVHQKSGASSSEEALRLFYILYMQGSSPDLSLRGVVCWKVQPQAQQFVI